MKISFKVLEKKRESAIRKLDKYLMRAGFSRGEGVWIYNNGSNASINFQTKIRFSESNGTIQLDISRYGRYGRFHHPLYDGEHPDGDLFAFGIPGALRYKCEINF